MRPRTGASCRACFQKNNAVTTGDSKKKLLSASVGVIMMCTAGIGSATEYLLTSTKPNQLHLVDVKARTESKTIEIPRAAPGALSIAVDETNAIAYVLANLWGSVIGMDLNTGEQVFRADLSQEGRRVRAIQGLEVSPDGKQVYVNCLPVKMGLGEYEVEDTYIAVYNTADGIDAKPVRKIPIPRRVVILASSKDGSELYALGHELHVFDPKTGEHLRDHKIRNRDAKDRTPPDILDFWNQWEQAGIFSTPFFTVDTSKAGLQRCCWPQCWPQCSAHSIAVPIWHFPVTCCCACAARSSTISVTCRPFFIKPGARAI